MRYPKEAVVFLDEHDNLWEYVGPSVFPSLVRVVSLDPGDRYLPGMDYAVKDKEKLKPLTAAARAALSIMCESKLCGQKVLAPGLTVEPLTFCDRMS